LIRGWQRRSKQQKTKRETAAKLTEDERKSQVIADREQQLDEREAALNKREFTASIVEKLTTKKLPVKLAAVLAEGCTKVNIDAILDATITPACPGTTVPSPPIHCLGGSPPPMREQRLLRSRRATLGATERR
jgi:hypothetical protein